MRKILITGANSYIGTSVADYLAQWQDKYTVDTIDMVDGSWREKSFTGYDAIFHVAGIVHRKETADNAELYYKVNRDLAFETAQKAKAEGVRQFIFLSSMSVYGLDLGTVKKDTAPNPVTNYGKSKLAAENVIILLQDTSFRVTVIRPPMIYGKGCKGNFIRLSVCASRIPIFPDYENGRSMICIENFCEFVHLLINNEDTGIFFPQNAEYVRTTDIITALAKARNKKVIVTKLFNPAIKLMLGRVGVISKAFGSLIYEKEMSEYKENYCIVGFEESMGECADE